MGSYKASSERWTDWNRIFIRLIGLKLSDLDLVEKKLNQRLEKYHWFHSRFTEVKIKNPDK